MCHEFYFTKCPKQLASLLMFNLIAVINYMLEFVTNILWHNVMLLSL